MKIKPFTVFDAVVRCFSIILFSDYCTSTYILSNSSHEWRILTVLSLSCLISHFFLVKELIKLTKWKKQLIFNSVVFWGIIILWIVIQFFPLPWFRIFPMIDSETATSGLGIGMLLGNGILIALFVIEKIVTIVFMILKNNQNNKVN